MSVSRTTRAWGTTPTSCPPALAEAPPPDTVHVWYAGLDVGPARLRQLASPLTAEERQRAERLRSEPHRKQFVAARGLLRLMLGRYLQTSPADVGLAYGPRGKPQLAEPPFPLRFNLSHSGELVVMVFACDLEVGVDMERACPARDVMGIAESFFSASERVRLRQLQGDVRQSAFYQAWTRKEAWLKATGDGLTRPLSDVEVAFGPGAPARLIRTGGGVEEVRGWSLYDLPLPPGYVAAVAAAGSAHEILCRPWYPSEDRSEEARRTGQRRPPALAR